jgi:hypothetical protein
MRCYLVSSLLVNRFSVLLRAVGQEASLLHMFLNMVCTLLWGHVNKSAAFPDFLPEVIWTLKDLSERHFFGDIIGVGSAEG